MNKKNQMLSLALGILLSSSSFAAPQSCSYQFDPASVHVGWTAFKTTQKVGVNGSFKKVDVDLSKSGDSVSHLLEGLKASVDVTTVDTGNPARDKTLGEFFFGKLKGSISGEIKNVSEADHSFNLLLNLNGKSKAIPMHYDLAGEAFTATGSIDILDFHASRALKSLNKKCFDLHKGPDGVSKTWPEVSLNLKGTLKQNCQ